MRIGIFGRGRLGGAVAAQVSREPELELAWSLGRGGIPESGADIALDASAAIAVRGHLDWAFRTGTNLVIGTTGWDQSILDGLKRDGLPIGLMVAPNFSLAVAFMRRLALALGRFSAEEPSSDVSVLERHHRMKADAPSGTAKALAASLAEGAGRSGGWVLGAAREGAVSVASLRAGAEIGYHEIRYESPLERIVLSHEASSRELFARGALSALRWMRGRRGLFTFDDFASDLIDRLFGPAGAGERN